MPRASAPPGASLRKPKKIKRSSGGRTAGERSVAKAYAPAYQKKARASRGAVRFEKDMRYLSTLPQFDDPARAQRKSQKFIEALIEKYGNKVDLGGVVANSNDPESYGAAGLYYPEDGGQIVLGASPTFDWNMGAMNPRGIRLTLKQQKRLSPQGEKFVETQVNSRQSRQEAKKSRLIAEKILAHEYAHAEQGETNALANPHWFTEGSAELKARKIWNDLHPNIPDPNRMYSNRVKRVRQYQKKHGSGSSPYKRSDKILGVPLDSEMAWNYLWNNKIYPRLPLEIGKPIRQVANAIYSVFD